MMGQLFLVSLNDNNTYGIDDIDIDYVKTQANHWAERIMEMIWTLLQQCGSLSLLFSTPFVQA